MIASPVPAVNVTPPTAFGDEVAADPWAAAWAAAGG